MQQGVLFGMHEWDLFGLLARRGLWALGVAAGVRPRPDDRHQGGTVGAAQPLQRVALVLLEGGVIAGQRLPSECQQVDAQDSTGTGHFLVD
jgi:hypothetical protein